MRPLTHIFFSNHQVQYEAVFADTPHRHANLEGIDHCNKSLYIFVRDGCVVARVVLLLAYAPYLTQRHKIHCRFHLFLTLLLGWLFVFSWGICIALVRFCNKFAIAPMAKVLL